MYGFFNRILKINATEHQFTLEPLNDEDLAHGLGGKGLGGRLLLRFNPPGADPLGPDNHLIFAAGPVASSKIFGSCRYGVFAKSPLTGFYAESYAGGRAPEAVSRAGFDAVVISGQSPSPVVVEINEDGAAFHDAADLMGLDAYQTEDEALKRHGTRLKGVDKSGAVVIGPAGENQVRFSVIENDYWRSAGRTGMGAVMGSKNIKALVFNGTCKREFADPDAIQEFVDEIKDRAKDNPAVRAYRDLGTPMMVTIMNEKNCFPTKYWSKGRADHWEKISAPAMKEACDVKPHACLRCIMSCGKMSTVKSGPHAGLTIEGPEYETIYAFGGLCLIDSIEEIAYLNDLCDRLGLDTITAGNLCAFAIEAAQRGAIDEELEYGRADQMADLLHKIAYRQGIGDDLADGVVPASRKWGLEDLAVHVKGMEPAGYDPRVLKGVGLGYAVSDRGACHLRATFYKPEVAGISPPDQFEDKVKIFLDYEDRLTLFDTLILCRFYRDMYPFPDLGRIIAATTGLQLDEAGLREMAARVTDDARRFNIQEGLTPEDDRLPKRLVTEPLETGQAMTEDELLRLRADYYRLRGWDESGAPR